jgi:hypothetical protein
VRRLIPTASGLRSSSMVSEDSVVFNDPWMGLLLVLSLGRDRLWDRPGRDARLIVS